MQVVETFQSKSGGGAYDVVVSGPGVAYCACMGWKMSKRVPKTCRHMDELVARGVLNADHTLTGSGTPAPQRVEPTPATVVAAATVAKPDLMLAHQVEKSPVEPWGREDWVAEVKLDGFRLALVATEQRTIQYSRLGNLHDHEFLSRLRLPVGTILDGEMTAGGEASVYGQGARGTEQFVVFDVLRVGEHDLRSQPWTFRRQTLEMLVQQLDEPRVVTSRVLGVPSEELAQDLIRAGVEGVMLKRRDSTYQGRRSWDWLKHKGTQTVDVVIVDMDALPTAPDRIAAGWKNLRYGYYVGGKLTVVGTLGVTGPPEELAQYVNKVVECKAYAVGKAGALRHPVVLRWREDKRPEDCTFE